MVWEENFLISNFLYLEIGMNLFKLLVTGFFLFSLHLSYSQVHSQGLKGRVLSSNGEPLAYASVYIKEIHDGIPTNEEGFFEVDLSPGRYEILVQHLAHQSLQRTVEISDGWVTLNVRLEPQVYGLDEVEVRSGQEDPGLSIMRRAISKAKYHRLQLLGYSMMVYIKGTGQLTDAPFFMKKKLKEEGISLNEAYTSESVSQITFMQPDNIEEKVISIRSSGHEAETSPAPYIGTSFYNERINEAISPLSRSAFIYYKFRLEGSFFENGILIHKIRVTPRSKGERVFEGFINIIDELWAIHSLNLTTSLFGFKVGVKQQYAPLKENIWMPMTHNYTFNGSFFGFAGEYQYLASTRDYDLTLNPDLVAETEILDEKVEEIPDDAKVFDHRTPALEQLADDGKMSRKDFRKMINQYEKESLKERKNAEVITERAYSIDSLAKTRDRAYWDSIRPIPLTTREMKGYRRDDSLAVVEAAKESEVDSIAQKSKRKFNPADILVGGRYYLGGGKVAGFSTNLTKISYNTVEGLNMGLSGYYRVEKTKWMPDSLEKTVKTWHFQPEFRYSFASHRTYATLEVRRKETESRNEFNWGVTGGRYIFQYNRDKPINEPVNAVYSLLLRQNYMKLFEQTFATAFWDHRPNDGFYYQLRLEYADRKHLNNHSDYSWYEKSGREFNSNQPVSREAPEEAFQDHQALNVSSTLIWRPGLKYRITNGKKHPLMDSAPLVRIDYTKGIPWNRTEANTANFDHIQVGFSHQLQFGVSGKLHYNLQAGTFLNKKRVYFMDYKHFGGNRTLFSDMGAASNYRFLDYYEYSTTGTYFSSILHYQFRKFLFTQLPVLSFSGVRENIFLNYLKTASSPHYVEVGYALDNLFRIFRVEIGAGFTEGKRTRAGMRLGIATFINISTED